MDGPAGATITSSMAGDSTISGDRPPAKADVAEIATAAARAADLVNIGFLLTH
jgi:hypothetical protein